MRRVLWLAPAVMMFVLTGCAVRASYYSRPHHQTPYQYRYYDHDGHYRYR